MKKIINPYEQYMYSYPHKTAYGPLSGISLKDYVPLLAGKGRGLYLHIPFCQTKCGYCNLFSVTGQGEEEMERYLDAVGRQIRQYQEMLNDRTEFADFTIGGGTPLLLTEDQLEGILDQIVSCFRFSQDRGMVIETAPNQTDRRKLSLLKQAGVTRVSMGIQSFSNEELSVLGRHHRAEKAREALELLKSFEFPCVNVDFIYGIPGQTVESLLSSLKEALTYKPDEIFLYPLYVKHGAKLIKASHGGLVLNPDLAFRQYQESARFLQSAGFRQDSMRRFVYTHGENQKRSFSECGFGTSLALGCGGRSYVGNLHFCTPYEITQKGCLARLRDFENTEDFCDIVHGIILSDEELRRRYVIRHLLLRPGLSEERYKKHFASQAKEDFPLLQEWEKEGLVKQERSIRKEVFLTLTETGMGLSDYLGPQLISPQVREKMERWEVVNGK